MASIEKGTITIKSAAAVLITIGSIVGSFTASYLGSGFAVEQKLLELEYAIREEASNRKHADEKLQWRVDALEQAVKPTTVTTFR